MDSFSYLEPACCSMSSSNIASWPAYRFLKRQVRWTGIPISFRVFQFIVIQTVKGFGIVNKAEIDVFFWKSLAFLMIHRMLAIWSLVPLPFLSPAWTSGIHGSHNAEAWLGEFWVLLCLHVRWVQLCNSLSILWHCLSLGLEWKTTFFIPVATAEFSKFAGILSAALSQHHLSGFEIAQLEFHQLH